MHYFYKVAYCWLLFIWTILRWILRRNPLVKMALSPLVVRRTLTLFQARMFKRFKIEYRLRPHRSRNAITSQPRIKERKKQWEMDVMRIQNHRRRLRLTSLKWQLFPCHFISSTWITSSTRIKWGYCTRLFATQWSITTFLSPSFVWTFPPVNLFVGC